MDTTVFNVAGLDVHHKSIQCAVRRQEPAGKVRRESRSFGTTTAQLRALADYLKSHGVTDVAMESTGVLWKPVWNILEGQFTLLLVNPQHLKRVPGRKTDVSDAEWLAQLLQCGLLRGSFVPPRAVRNLRDLTRHRAKLMDERTRVANRIHKSLEDANIKLATVASDILGVSGREMLSRLVSGDSDTEQLAELARGKLRKKIPDLKCALEGHVTEHHRVQLDLLLTQLDHVEHQITQLGTLIDDQRKQLLPDADFQHLDAIPGVNRIIIENVLAEIGPDMSVFPDEHHLCSWTGLCPGNEESAGKRLRARTRHANPWLRRTLTEAAWAASHSKNSYLAAQYHRLVPRRGKKRALIAVAHSLLVIIYHILKNHTEYKDLGRNYFDRLAPERLQRYYVRRLESLGLEVIVKPVLPERPAA
jgi:transposase